MADNNTSTLSEDLSVLLGSRLLDMPGDPAFDRLARLATRMLKAPAAMIVLAHDDQPYFTSLIGLDDLPSNMERAFWQPVTAARPPHRVEDMRQHPLFQNSPLVEEYGLVACAVVPLTSDSGDTLGALYVFDRQPRQWTPDEMDNLHDLSCSVVSELALRGEQVRRQRLEANHYEIEARLAAVVSTAPVILFATDKQGIITFSVGKGLEALGRQQNESAGRNIFEAYADQPQALALIAEALAGNVVTGLVENNDLIFNNWYSPVYDRTGAVSGMIAVSVDVTERMLAERALQDLVEQLVTLHEIGSELSSSLNLDSVLQVSATVLQRVTRATDGFIGLFQGDQIQITHAIGRYQQGQLFDKNRGIIARTLRSREPQWIRDVSSDPDYIPHIPETRSKICLPLTYRERLIGIIDLETPHDHHFTREAFDFVRLLVGQITLAIDNAQLYELSQSQLSEMAQLYTRVSALEKLKTDIIRIAAHDLRNPLTQVIGYTDLLLEDVATLNVDQVEFLESIQKAGKKMERLINDILSLQRIEAGSGGEVDVFDLTQIVRDIFAENEDRARQKDQRYSLHLPDVPVRITGDSAQISEAVDNIIGNALKYTPPGGSISVALRLDDSAKKRVVFEVKDSGVGVPAEQQANLFQPFFRAKSSETTQIDGTGLGLHLVRNIVERHHGQMRFYSEYGHGSTFGFELPAIERGSAV